MQQKLTQRVAQSAKPGAKPYQIHDVIISGFILRVQPNGKKLWKLIQHKRPVTIGAFPQLTYGMAETKVKAILSGEIETPDKPVPTIDKFIEQFYEAWCNAHHAKPRTALSAIKSFKMGSVPLDQIKLEDVERARIKRKKKGNLASTINRACNDLKAMINKAVDLEIIEKNPIAKLKRLKTDSNAMVRYLSLDEEKRLLDHLYGGEVDDYLAHMTLVALNTGLRRGEILSLKQCDVDLDKRMLTVQGSGAKSGQTRHVPLNLLAWCVLYDRKDNEPVFGQREFKRSWKTLLTNSKIDDFRFHDTRHSFASKLVMKGVPLNTTRELLGHADLTMTLRYAHLAPDNLKAAVELIE